MCEVQAHDGEGRRFLEFVLDESKFAFQLARHDFTRRGARALTAFFAGPARTAGERDRNGGGFRPAVFTAARAVGAA